MPGLPLSASIGQHQCPIPRGLWVLCPRLAVKDHPPPFTRPRQRDWSGMSLFLKQGRRIRPWRSCGVWGGDTLETVNGKDHKAEVPIQASSSSAFFLFFLLLLLLHLPLVQLCLSPLLLFHQIFYFLVTGSKAQMTNFILGSQA